MKRLQLAVVGLLLFLSISLFASISDPFTDSDGTLLTAHSAGGGTWVINEGSVYTINSNKATMGGFGNGAARRSEAAGFPANQFAQADVQALSVDAPGAGVELRASGTTYYIIVAAANGASADIVVYERVAASNTFLVQVPSGFAVDTVFPLKATIAGTTIEVFANGVSKGTTTGSNIASGAPGLYGYAGTAGNTWDNFSCTDANAATTHSKIVGGGVFW